MSAMGDWLRRVWFLLNRRRMERDLAREMEAHREMAGGHGAPFGNLLRLREESADVWGWSWLDSAWQDLRFAARTLKPGFAFTAGLVLSIGIGLNLGLFQMVSVALVRPPAVQDPATLVQLIRRSPTMTNSNVPYPVADAVGEHNRVFSAVLARVRSELVWGDDAGDRVAGAFVSGNWFREVGYGAAAGRAISEQIDGRPDAEPIAVISDGLWRSRFGADPAVIGRSIRLNGRPVLVAGVAPREFPSMKAELIDIWIPMQQYNYFHAGGDFRSGWISNNTELYARLLPGTGLPAVRENMRAVMAEVARIRPVEFGKGEWLEPLPGSELFRSPEERRKIRTVWMLMGALTLLVLLIACSNVGNLLLSRSAVRAREMSVRVAMGASRWRLMRQLLLESLLLALIGSAGGIVLASWGCRLIAARVQLPPNMSFEPDPPLFATALAAAFVTAIAAGLAPAWRASRCKLASAMKDGGQQNSMGLESTRLRKVLLGAQVAASCLLLVVAGLMVDGARRTLNDDHGFAYSGVAALHPGLSRYGIKGAEARAWWAKLRAAIAAMPEAENAAVVSWQPLGRGSATSHYGDAPGVEATVLAVDERFFDVMGVRLLAGRNFAPADAHNTAIIISRRLAQAMYGTADVVGKGFPKSGASRTIIGVTADAPLIKIEANNTAEQYEPLNPEQCAEYLMVVKSRSDAAALLAPLRAAARQADGRVLAKAVTLSSEMDRRMESSRLASLLFAAAGLAALALACVGIYGVVSFGASARTKEIGIRMALGSPGKSVLGVLLRQQFWPLALGIAAGLAGAKALSGPMSGEPIYLRAMGFEIPVLVVALFTLTGGLAVLAPSLRALRTDPLRALRHE